MPSALWLVRPALHSRFDAALTVPVYDGPRVRTETPKQFVVVGANTGGGEDIGPAMRSVQTPSPHDGTWRHEEGEVDCVAVAWAGDSDLAALRTAARALVDACETAVNADRSLGGLLQPTNNFAEVTALEIREAQTDKGAFVEAVFTVSYGTLLT